ncbi:Acyl-CoA synthetase family member 3, mitochondrial [Smittium culicis]|uniref:Acyl-CoA synthetase family member 3, mitochondrial n=1 Tax=Smittium culicis TaxID=133412 RepID=A0A1R1YTP5_9FUNG|nr:Acyl-CoA synthetase family member 3, mitochondrial [Smittium culicis]
MFSNFCNLPIFLAAQAQANLGVAAKPAVIDSTSSHSYAQLLLDSYAVESEIIQHITSPGNNVALLIPNSYLYVISTLGIWLSGSAVVPLSLMHVKSELGYFLSDSDCKAVLSTNEHLELLTTVCNEFDLSVKIILVDTIPLYLVPPSDIPSHNIDINSNALVVYTSGTTGKPKGVVSSHINVNAQLTSLRTAWEINENDRLLHVLPLHHTHTLINKLMSFLFCLFCKNKKALLLKKFESYSESELEASKVFKKWEQLTTQVMVERYGMSEIGMALSNSGTDKSQRFPGHVGTPLPNVSVRLVNEAGVDVTNDPNLSGEVQIKGDTVFKRFKTGDVGNCNSDGVFKLLGRNSTDIIKSGGYKLSSIELEQHILECELVREISVVAIPDEILEFVPGAAVVFKKQDQENSDDSKEMIDQLRKWCLKEMSQYKVPRFFVVVDELPVNLMRKVDKKKVLALFK